MEHPPSPRSTPPQNKFKRALTPFLAREMLYDYVSGDMDPDRRVAVAVCLENDRETREALEEIELGVACTDALSKTQPSPELLAALSQAESAASLGRRYSRWSNWPETLRWSIVALSASVAAAGAVSLAPWRYLNEKGAPSNLVVLAPIPTTSAGKTDEGNQVASTSQEATEPTSAEGTSVAERSGDEEEMPLQAPPLQPSPDSAPASTPSPAASARVDRADGDKPERRDAKAKGFVYRAWLSTVNVEESTPKVVEAVRELGGEKAGEVELGWRRGTGSYFHFTLPEKNEQEALDRLKAYGRVRISKDPHPRVMPKGQVRFILWVEADHSR